MYFGEVLNFIIESRDGITQTGLKAKRFHLVYAGDSQVHAEPFSNSNIMLMNETVCHCLLLLIDRQTIGNDN